MRSSDQFPPTKFEIAMAIAARVSELEAGDDPVPDINAQPHMSFPTIARMEYEGGHLRYGSRLTYPPDENGKVHSHIKEIGTRRG